MIISLQYLYHTMQWRDQLRPMKFKAHYWFASDVTAAMLGVKNKSISLRWEMNSILMQI